MRTVEGPWRTRRRGMVVVLGAEAALAGAFGATLLVEGVVVAAIGCAALSALAAGLAVSIDEGFPTPGAAVVAWQGTGAAVALLAVSGVAALLVAVGAAVAAVIVGRRGDGQMRRPVPAQ